MRCNQAISCDLSQHQVDAHIASNRRDRMDGFAHQSHAAQMHMLPLITA